MRHGGVRWVSFPLQQAARRGWGASPIGSAENTVVRCIAGRIMRRGSGQAMVEIALVLPLLMLLMLGIIQLVLIGNVALSVSQAATACARYACLFLSRCTSIETSAVRLFPL